MVILILIGRSRSRVFDKVQVGVQDQNCTKKGQVSLDLGNRLVWVDLFNKCVNLVSSLKIV